MKARSVLIVGAIDQFASDLKSRFDRRQPLSGLPSLRLGLLWRVTAIGDLQTTQSQYSSAVCTADTNVKDGQTRPDIVFLS